MLASCPNLFWSPTECGSAFDVKICSQRSDGKESLAFEIGSGHVRQVWLRDHGGMGTCDPNDQPVGRKTVIFILWALFICGYSFHRSAGSPCMVLHSCENQSSSAFQIVHPTHGSESSCETNGSLKCSQKNHRILQARATRLLPLFSNRP
jgi:hypothetical protein